MDYLELGDKIDYDTYNGLVYLLRKFKRLTSDLKISKTISSDYGDYTITGGLTSVGGNFILEDDVTISSTNVLRNCFYTFVFTIVDVNLSGTVNKRIVKVTGDTGDNGVLEVVLEPSLLESDEVLLPDFKVDIVFDEHEYYTPISALNITLDIEELYIDIGETNTITATVIDDSGDPVSGLNLGFNVNGNVENDVTDSDGVASITYTGTGAGWVNVTVSSESIRFYDGEVTIATVTWNYISLGGYGQWLPSTNEVIIDWGDGTSDTVKNPNTPLTHRYTGSESSHTILLIGNVTSLGGSCFSNTGLTSITIPSTVTNLGNSCFSRCTGLTSITIPSSVTSIGNRCFQGCTGLTSITVPNSVTSIGEVCFMDCTGLASVTLPSNITSLKPSCFQNTGLTSITIPDGVTNLGANCFSNSASLTTVVIPSSVTVIGRGCFEGCTSLVDYQLYWTGNNIITYNSSTMPDNTNTIFIIPSGETANYTSKGYPTGKLVERGETLTLTCDKPIIQSSETSTVTATLKQSGSPLTGKTLNYQVKHGSTVISTGTKTTNSSGQATISYTGTGVGDVTVEVDYGILLQETFVLEDCINYDPLTSNSGKWTIPSGVSSTYSSDGWNVSATSYGQVKLTDKLTSDCSVEFTLVNYNIVSSGGSCLVYAYTNGETTPNKIILDSRGSSYSFSSVFGRALDYRFSNGTKFRIEYTSSTLKVYENDVLIDTDPNSVGLPTRFEFHIGAGGRTATYKDLKVKAL